MKIAPIWRRMKESHESFEPVFVHTGQHYDDNMSRVFLQELGLPDPDVSLGVGSASHAVQTANIMLEFEKVVLKYNPDIVVVVGDVNSTVACALVASKLHIPVAHVEAGLRSFDMRMPEEINRICTDHISDILFTTCKDADENLKKEGIHESKIHFVGNVMIESLIRTSHAIEDSRVLDHWGLKKDDYCLVTLHRPSNVDDETAFAGIMDALIRISEEIPVVFPAHPRTQKRMEDFGFKRTNDRMKIIDPVGYFDFLGLEKNAKLVLTDSGGVQEETTFFGIPCLTIRENTERPITIKQGTNILVGVDPKRIIEERRECLSHQKSRTRVPEYWDEGVSERIVDVLKRVDDETE